MDTKSTVSINIEIPEALHNSIQGFISGHPGWDHDRAMQAALSLFLMQNGAGDQGVNRMYLDSLFGADDHAQNAA